MGTRVVGSSSPSHRTISEVHLGGDALGGEAFGVEVRLAVQLGGPRRDAVGVALFLGGVLGELLCHRLGREASRSAAGRPIAQEEDQFGGERLVEDLDDASAVCAVGVGTAP